MQTPFSGENLPLDLDPIRGKAVLVFSLRMVLVVSGISFRYANPLFRSKTSPYISTLSGVRLFLYFLCEWYWLFLVFLLDMRINLLDNIIPLR